MSRLVRFFGTVAMVVAVLAACEVIAGFACRHLAERHGLPFYLPVMNQPYEQYYDQLEARAHPDLGWDASQMGSDYYDSSGSRPIPAFPDPARYPARISLYGDSFTEGYGVDARHAWSNYLAILQNCRVANYGVAGYGTDQAYLRYQDNWNDPARVVILEFLTENIKGNVNQFRNLIASSSYCFIKPRFLLDSKGQLALMPIPVLSREEYGRLPQNPETVFPHDYFVPGGPGGVQKMAFPYLWRVIRTSDTLLKRMLWQVQPYQELLRPGHSSRALELTAAIFAAFARSARERGQHPLILIIPTVADVDSYLQHRTWTYQPLLPLLEERRLEYLDTGPEIIRYLQGADPRTIYDPKIHYHFNAAGNRFLAEYIHRYIGGHAISY
jgi:hypothetical protein